MEYEVKVGECRKYRFRGEIRVGTVESVKGEDIVLVDNNLNDATLRVSGKISELLGKVECPKA